MACFSHSCSDIQKEETTLRKTDSLDRLVSLTPAKASLSSRGGSCGCSSLDGSIGQDTTGEFLLGLGKAGPRPSVIRMDLKKIGKKKGIKAVTRLWRL